MPPLIIGRILARPVLHQVGNLLDKLDKTDSAEAKKHCNVCGRRIRGAKFYSTARFYCRVCGHRTHFRCAETASYRICKKCAP